MEEPAVYAHNLHNTSCCSFGTKSNISNSISVAADVSELQWLSSITSACTVIQPLYGVHPAHQAALPGGGGAAAAATRAAGAAQHHTCSAGRSLGQPNASDSRTGGGGSGGGSGSGDGGNGGGGSCNSSLEVAIAIPMALPRPCGPPPPGGHAASQQRQPRLFALPKQPRPQQAPPPSQPLRQTLPQPVPRPLLPQTLRQPALSLQALPLSRPTGTEPAECGAGGDTDSDDPDASHLSYQEAAYLWQPRHVPQLEEQLVSGPAASLPSQHQQQLRQLQQRPSQRQNRTQQQLPPDYSAHRNQGGGYLCVGDSFIPGAHGDYGNYGDVEAQARPSRLRPEASSAPDELPAAVASLPSPPLGVIGRSYAEACAEEERQLALLEQQQQRKQLQRQRQMLQGEKLCSQPAPPPSESQQDQRRQQSGSRRASPTMAGAAGAAGASGAAASCGPTARDDVGAAPTVAMPVAEWSAPGADAAAASAAAVARAGRLAARAHPGATPPATLAAAGAAPIVSTLACEPAEAPGVYPRHEDEIPPGAPGRAHGGVVWLLGADANAAAGDATGPAGSDDGLTYGAAAASAAAVEAGTGTGTAAAATAARPRGRLEAGYRLPRPRGARDLYVLPEGHGLPLVVLAAPSGKRRRSSVGACDGAGDGDGAGVHSAGLGADGAGAVAGTGADAPRMAGLGSTGAGAGAAGGLHAAALHLDMTRRQDQQQCHRNQQQQRHMQQGHQQEDQELELEQLEPPHRQQRRRRARSAAGAAAAPVAVLRPNATRRCGGGDATDTDFAGSLAANARHGDELRQAAAGAPACPDVAPVLDSAAPQARRGGPQQHNGIGSGLEPWPGAEAPFQGEPGSRSGGEPGPEPELGSGWEVIEPTQGWELELGSGWELTGPGSGLGWEMASGWGKQAGPGAEAEPEAGGARGRRGRVGARARGSARGSARGAAGHADAAVPEVPAGRGRGRGRGGSPGGRGTGRGRGRRGRGRPPKPARRL